MGRKELSSQDVLRRLPGGDLMAISDYVGQGIMIRAFDQPDIVPNKGPGRHSLRNAVRRREFYENNPSPTFLYTDQQALQYRRNHNRNLLTPRGGKR